MAMDVSRTVSLIHGLLLTLADRLWHRVTARALPLKQLPKPTGPYAVGCADVMRSGSEGVFVRILYPCERTVTSPVVQWMPNVRYVDGLAFFVRVWPPLFRFLFRLVVGEVSLPVEWKAPPLAPPANGWPLLLFSHGLGGCRSTYTTLTAELASHGFIVAATEHRDRTACMTFRVEEGVPEAEWVAYRRVVEGEDAYVIRNAQAHQRSRECSQALDLMLSLSSGEKVINALETDHDEWAKGLKGLKVDAGRVGLLGHSFGGATLLLALSSDPRFRVGVALDAWMYPVRKEPLEDLKSPLLFVNMERFQTEVNLRCMGRVRSRVVTLKGGAHQNPSDVPFLSQGTRFDGLFSSGTTLPALLASHLISDLSLNFLNKHLDLPLVKEASAELETNAHLLSYEAEAEPEVSAKPSLKSFL